MPGSYAPPSALHNPTVGMAPPDTWGDAINTAFDYFDGLIDDAAYLTNFTPLIDQGVNVTKTVNVSRVKRLGKKTILFNWLLSITSSGSSATNIFITLPYSAVYGVNIAVPGWFKIWDASAGVLRLGSPTVNTSQKVFGSLDGSVGNAMGANPAIQLASGDQLEGCVIYETSAA